MEKANGKHDSFEKSDQIPIRSQKYGGCIERLAHADRLLAAPLSSSLSAQDVVVFSQFRAPTPRLPLVIPSSLPRLAPVSAKRLAKHRIADEALARPSWIQRELDLSAPREESRVYVLDSNIKLSKRREIENESNGEIGRARAWYRRLKIGSRGARESTRGISLVSHRRLDELRWTTGFIYREPDNAVSCFDKLLRSGETPT